MSVQGKKEKSLDKMHDIEYWLDLSLLFFDEVEVDGHRSLRALRVLLLVASMQEHFLIVDDAYLLLLGDSFFLLVHHLHPWPKVVLVPGLALGLGRSLFLLTSFIASFFLVGLLLSSGALGSSILLLLFGSILGGFLCSLLGCVAQLARLYAERLLFFLR